MKPFSRKPERLSSDKLQRVLDFCERYVDLPVVDVIGRDGERLTINLRTLMARDFVYGTTPLRPDWDALDVVYTIAMKAFNECWGIPEKQMILLTQMSEPDLAALFVARMLRRLYVDTTDPKFREHVVYRAENPKLVLTLAEAYQARSGVVDRLKIFSKRMFSGGFHERNPKRRKQLQKLQRQYRVFR